MKLLIDAGNTRLKWCWFDGEDLPLEYDSAEYDDLDEEGSDLFKIDGPDADEIIICNVGGDELAYAFVELFAHWQITPAFVRSTAQCGGISNGYSNYEQLGADRWMAMLGAWFIQQEAVCIVDCGTAVTIDVLNDEGQHLGGLIIPGMELMQDVLVGDTDGIDIDEDEIRAAAAGLLATDTSNAVAAGTIYALVALIDRIRQDVATELDLELPLILTGGDVDIIQPLLSCESSYEPMLIFQGMLIAHAECIS